MFERVLVATDLSPGAELMLDRISELQQLGMKEVVLLWVVEIAVRFGPTSLIQKQRLELLEARKKPLEERGLRVETLAPVGFPAQEIVNAAREQEASLIVISSRGRNTFRSFFLGSTVSDVIRMTSTPTLIERVEVSPADQDSLCHLVCGEKIRRVLLATDFSDAAREAENTVRNLAPYAEQIIVVSVVDEGSTADEVEEKTEAVNQALEALRDQLPGGRQLDTQVHARFGIASDVINDVAEEEDATLIVMGTRGKNRLPGLYLGSTAEAVARRARRPVLLVPNLDMATL